MALWLGLLLPSTESGTVKIALSCGGVTPSRSEPIAYRHATPNQGLSFLQRHWHHHWRSHRLHFKPRCTRATEGMTVTLSLSWHCVACWVGAVCVCLRELHFVQRPAAIQVHVFKRRLRVREHVPAQCSAHGIVVAGLVSRWGMG